MLAMLLYRTSLREIDADEWPNLTQLMYMIQKKFRYAGAASPLDGSVADPKKHASTPHDCVTIPNLVTVGENVWA